MMTLDYRTRPPFDTYYLDIAEVVARRGDCRRSRVGAVLVSQNKRTVTFGYNGTQLPGQPGCLDGACPRGLLSYTELPPGGDYSSCIAVHAEMNCLYEYPKLWRQGTMYVTRAPCEDCVTEMANEEVARVVWRDTEIHELLLQER